MVAGIIVQCLNRNIFIMVCVLLVGLMVELNEGCQIRVNILPIVVLARLFYRCILRPYIVSLSLHTIALIFYTTYIDN